MRRDDPSFRLVVAAARGLADLVDQVVFLGGATTNLLLTDPAAPSVRPTLDVDVVVEVASTVEYLRLERELERRGFVQDESPGAPRCRRIREGVRLDVMPTDATILGFSNRWYRSVCETAMRVELEPDLSIRLVTPSPAISRQTPQVRRERPSFSIASSGSFERLSAFERGETT